MRGALAVLPFCYAGPAIAAACRSPPVLVAIVSLGCAALAAWVVVPAVRGARNPAAPVPRAVFGLSLVGALYCLGSGQWIAAGVLAAFFALSRVLARAIAQRGS